MTEQNIFTILPVIGAIFGGCGIIAGLLKMPIVLLLSMVLLMATFGLTFIVVLKY